MNITLNRPDDTSAKLIIEVEKSDYQPLVDSALNNYRKKANIPGFRSGKVPMSYVKKAYGKAVLVEEVQKLVNEKLVDYIEENKLPVLGNPISSEDQPQIDFDKDEKYDFYFDMAISPEIDLSLSKEDKLTYYRVHLENDLLDEQLNSYKSAYGKYEITDGVSEVSDMLKGEVEELENGEPKAGGITLENAVLLPSYIKDEEIKNKFVGLKSGDVVDFNPRKAYDNDAEIASFLNMKKEEVEGLDSDFRFKVKEVTRFHEAELNQELFDKVLGAGVVSSEEEFRTKVEEELNKHFIPQSDNYFMEEVNEMLLDKTKDLHFADDILKRWLKLSEENRSEEEIEKSFPKILENLRCQLAKEEIIKDQKFTVEKDEIRDLAVKMAKLQLAQYGIANAEAELLDKFVESMVSNQETRNSFIGKILDDKIADYLKKTITVEEKEIGSKEFSEMIKERNEALKSEEAGE